MSDADHSALRWIMRTVLQRQCDGWQRLDSARSQREIDAIVAPEFAERPAGHGRIENFTVACERGRPAFTIEVGRLDDSRRRRACQHGAPRLNQASNFRRARLVSSRS